jgi:membrane-bound lytic murein transglycosylase F
MNFVKKIMRFNPIKDDSAKSEVTHGKPAEPEKLSSKRCLIFLVLLVPFSGWTQKPFKSLPHLERVKQTGELRVVTRYGPSTYYEGANGTAGLEYDLARLFAARLGVEVTFIVPDSGVQVVRTVAAGKADIAAGLFANESRRRKLRFGPAYRRISEQVLYGEGHQPPGGPEDLGKRGILEVAAGSGHSSTLKALRRRYRSLNWRISFEHNVDELLVLASEGAVDYTVANSDQALFLRRYYPRLQVAFDIGKARELAWALPMKEDPSLAGEVGRFFEEIRRNKQLDQLIDRYFGHAEAFDGNLDSALRRDYRNRLPKFRRLFVQAGKRHDLDWRLLAAIAYQESKWSSGAISPEGVQGMMMLTGDTARELKVRDRFDAAESIRGAASYLRRTLETIPSHIQEPDRTWYALAAYNLGYGHIEDARSLVRKRGGDPDKWIELKTVLPLLGHRQWFRKTKHGKARGALAVHYVNSVRRYYDLLVWLTERGGDRQAMGVARVGDSGV